MSKEVLRYLNTLLTGELTSVHQYFLHSTVLKENGINRLAEKMKSELNEELEHINKLSERILLLKGVPNFQDISEVSKYNGKFTKNTVQKILEDDLKLEEEGLKDYREAISVAEEERDFVSKILLEQLLKNEEEHFHWIEEQISHIGLIGIENYLKIQI